MIHCELCHTPKGSLLYRDDRLQVLLVDEAGYPGFCRVIWREHIKEMSDLAEADRLHLFHWLMRTEQALRSVMLPTKINLASLGNVVPHLHWHVIPRFDDDAHFPRAIWASPIRAAPTRDYPNLAQQLRSALM